MLERRTLTKDAVVNSPYRDQIVILGFLRVFCFLSLFDILPFGGDLFVEIWS